MKTLHELIDYADTEHTWKNKYKMNGQSQNKANLGWEGIIEIKEFSGKVPSIKILMKLIFLYNHLIQYHVVGYTETIYRITSLHDERKDIVIFRPKKPIAEHLHDLLDIDTTINTYLNAGYINKRNLESANRIWEKLKYVAGIDKE